MLQSVIFEGAIGILLNQIASQVNSHSLCVLTTNYEDFWQVKNFPTFISGCDERNQRNSEQFLWGVNHGCAFFLTTSGCVFPFLTMFPLFHDAAKAKLFPKVMIVVDHNRKLSNETISKIMKSDVVRKAVPQTFILQPNHGKPDWINIWAAFPFSKASKISNRYFLRNQSLEYETPFVSFITDLDKIEVRQGVFDYPPFTKTSIVSPGSGNANIFGSNNDLDAQMEGLESTIIIEFCRFYNCIVSARLDYDESLWGFTNKSGIGVLGAIVTQEIDVTGCGCFIMGYRYDFMQYTVPIQQSMITHFLPKPKPLPFVYLPFLPFPAEMWIAVGVTLLIGAFFVFLVFYAGVKAKVFNEKGQNLSDSFFMMLQMNLFQAIQLKTKLWSKIVILSTFLISSLVIGNLYIRGLAGIMTLTPYESPIDTLEKLVKSDLIWGETSNTWIISIMESTYPPHQKYVKKFIEEIDIQKIHQWVKEQRMAVIVNKMQDGILNLLDYVDRNDSEFLMIMYTAILTTKTWPWIEQLNRIVAMQQESGIRKRWAFMAAVTTMDYAIQRNMEENSEKREIMEAETITVTHILGPLFILLVGYGIASLTFLTEICWAKRQGVSISRSHQYLSR